MKRMLAYVVGVWVASCLAALPAEEQPAPTSDATAKVEASRVLTGKVVEVADGDSLMVLVGKDLHEFDLAGIDAPEADQATGQAAQKALARRVLDKTVEVLPFGYSQGVKKLCGVVYSSGCVNTQMVREGSAWYDPQFGAFPVLAEAEQQARKAKLGLWADAKPIPPWEWRQTKTASGKSPSGANSGNTAASRRTGRSSSSGAAPNARDSANGAEKAKPAPQPAAGNQAMPPQLERWLTTSSGKRHNSSCRYFKTTNGRPCAPDEGQPCKICGG